MVLTVRRSDLRVPAVVALVLVLLAACTPTEPAKGALLNASGDAIYKDATYVVSYSHTGTDGWQTFLQLRVRAGLITEACYGAVRADGQLVRDDENYRERFRLRTGTDLVPILDTLETALIAEQQLPLRLPANSQEDRVAWSGSFTALADTALQLARVGDATTAVIPAAGPYTGHDHPDELGWEARMVIIFDEAGIATASFEERRIGSDGAVMVKADDPIFTEAYERVLGLTPAGVAAELLLQFSQGAAPEAGEKTILDGITGATGTTDRFQILADRILATRVSVPLPNKLCTR